LVNIVKQREKLGFELLLLLAAMDFVEISPSQNPVYVHIHKGFSTGKTGFYNLHCVKKEETKNQYISRRRRLYAFTCVEYMGNANKLFEKHKKRIQNHKNDKNDKLSMLVWLYVLRKSKKALSQERPSHQYSET
jgi:hypothetical protein